MEPTEKSLAVNEWTEDELAAAVAAYRRMEAQHALGAKVEKASVYRELAALHGRTPKAWEYRMQNISHVLKQADKEWLPGLRPAANVGTNVELQLAKLLALPSEVGTFVTGPTKEMLQTEVKNAEAAGAFSPLSEIDGRKRVLATIVRRQGQQEFRSALLEAYGGRCAMTDCDVVDALEAAHICSYSGRSSNAVSNGLLLRADVHTLFDLYLLAVSPDSLRIAVAPALRNSAYADLDGRELMRTVSTELSPSVDCLALHRSRCTW